MCTNNRKEVQAIPQKSIAENAEFVNEVIFKEGTVDVVKYKETRVKNDKEGTINKFTFRLCLKDVKLVMRLGFML